MDDVKNGIDDSWLISVIKRKLGVDDAQAALLIVATARLAIKFGYDCAAKRLDVQKQILDFMQNEMI